MKTIRRLEFLHEFVLISKSLNVILKYVVILLGDDDGSFPSGHFTICTEECSIMGDARDTAKKKKADEKKGAKPAAKAPAAKAPEAKAAAKPAAKAGKK
jgi:hypothetical protein